VIDATTRRFACTQCGACCNRSPEVELSEAAGLADIFVFRLLFRLYSMPATPERSASESAELFYQKKRLLAAHAARKYPRKVMRDGKPVERMHYLMVSALALDTRRGACAALEAGRCGIYERRPLACRAVPFHYARADALAEQDLDAFVTTPGYRCDSGKSAPVVLEGGRIVDAASLEARAHAHGLAAADRLWKEAIVRRMKQGSFAGDRLPTLGEVEAQAGVEALTISMRIAWDIAADARIISPEGAEVLVRTQLETIERELAGAGRTGADAGTLAEMAAEYRAALNA
jgi:Fe-S-cluster containining protein